MRNKTHYFCVFLFFFALLCLELLFDLKGGKYVKYQMVLHRRENESVSRILFRESPCKRYEVNEEGYQVLLW